MRVERDGGRARVTSIIQRTLEDLVRGESDYQKKKRHPASWYQTAVASKLDLDSQDNPSLRSYEDLLHDIREKLRKQYQTDGIWSIGSCDGAKVPSDIIPVLINIQKFLDKVSIIPKSEVLSKRHARWYARLYPCVQSLISNRNQKAYRAFGTFLLIVMNTALENSNEESLKKLAFDFAMGFKKNPNPNTTEVNVLVIIWLVAIGIQYARGEQNSAAKEGDPFDTSELDNVFFVQEDLSVEALYDSLSTIFFTNEQRNRLHKEISLKDLEASFGNMTAKQASSMNEFSQAMSLGFIERRKWIMLHPREYEEISKIWEGKNERIH